ncbi:MAG: response regulator transcription factor [Hyphomicrobiales bacterium]
MAHANNEQRPRLLVVDDDRGTRDLVRAYFEQHNFLVTTAKNGQELLSLLARGPYDLILLDVMLPDRDGLSLCREISAKSHVPIILLTAIAETADRIIGLELGADDYVTKPFEPRELLARVRVVLRRRARPGGAASTDDAGSRLYRFEGWSLDCTRRRLESPDGVVVPLTAAEYDLLVAFVGHPNRPLSRERLLDLTKGHTPNAGFDRSIDILVSRLRKKLQRNSPNDIIKTVRGAGYVFGCEVSAS